MLRWKTLKRAFTLAEVLITLGIIGIVAALTLPNLIAKYQNKVLVTQLKKSVSIFEQGMKMLYVDAGVATWDDLNLSDNNGLSHNSEELLARFKKYFKVVDSSLDYDTSDLSYIKKLNSSEPVSDWANGGFYILGFRMNFADGSTWYYMGPADSDVNNFQMLVDVNGKKGPNQIGRDVFKLVYTSKGVLAGALSRDYFKYDYNLSGEALDEADNMMSGYYPCRTGAESWSAGICFQKIVDDGWEMNY